MIYDPCPPPTLDEVAVNGGGVSLTPLRERQSRFGVGVTEFPWNSSLEIVQALEACATAPVSKVAIEGDIVSRAHASAMADQRSGKLCSCTEWLEKLAEDVAKREVL